MKTTTSHQNAAQENANAMLESAIDRALQQPPQIAVAPGFAARVRSALPAQPHVGPAYSVGRRTAMLAGGALIVAIFCIAPHTAPNFGNLTFDIELSLVAELAAVAVWLSRPQPEL